jgi:hypothetical protein
MAGEPSHGAQVHASVEEITGNGLPEGVRRERWAMAASALSVAQILS